MTTGLTPRHCKTCTCVGPSVVAKATVAAAGVPNIQIVDVTVGAQPFVVVLPLAGAAGAMPPVTFDVRRFPVRS